jgi:type III pantothenate kinase
LYLIVDLGNTLAKFFLYNKDQCVIDQSVALENFHDMAESLVLSHPVIEGLIYSDVSNQADDFFEKFTGRFPVIAVGSQMRLPFVNSYESPDSLGSDRIVLVAAACKSHPNTNVLIIDLGSCITYDFLDANNKYHGGAISPGFGMRYKSMHHYTGNLPLLEAKKSENPTGKNTDQAIHAGIYFGIIDEINARIEYYDRNYDSLTVILTGGDSNKLPKTLKNSIFAHSNFLAEGMFHLLKLNIDS